MAVSRVQAQTTLEMQQTMSQLTAVFITPQDPMSWVAEDDNEMLMEMLNREAQATADAYSGPYES